MSSLKGSSQQEAPSLVPSDTGELPIHEAPIEEEEVEVPMITPMIETIDIMEEAE